MVWMIDFLFFFFKVDRKWKKQESSHMYSVLFYIHTVTSTVLNDEFGELTRDHNLWSALDHWVELHSDKAVFHAVLASSLPPFTCLLYLGLGLYIIGMQKRKLWSWNLWVEMRKVLFVLLICFASPVKTSNLFPGSKTRTCSLFRRWMSWISMH